MVLATTFSEKHDQQLSFALHLLDGFTQRPHLLGETTVRLSGKAYRPYPKQPGASFLFFGVPPAAYTIEVRNPLYVPVDINVHTPFADPRWPAFPDVSLADLAKALDDPTQPLAYRSQRAAASLKPHVGYPFPQGTSLVRGQVVALGQPLPGASVGPLGGSQPYVTGADGQFVLFFPVVDGVVEAVTLHATRPPHAPVDQQIDVRRGQTVTTTIVMA